MWNARKIHECLINLNKTKTYMAQEELIFLIIFTIADSTVMQTFIGTENMGLNQNTLYPLEVGLNLLSVFPVS